MFPKIEKQIGDLPNEVNQILIRIDGGTVSCSFRVEGEAQHFQIHWGACG
jgi:hypothetical protein